MLCKFEITRVKHICDLTNALLDFEIDNSIKYKFIEILENNIELFEHNKFSYEPLDKIYLELNDKIDECIELLRKRIQSIKCGKALEVSVEFDIERYNDLISKQNL